MAIARPNLEVWQDRREAGQMCGGLIQSLEFDFFRGGSNGSGQVAKADFVTLADIHEIFEEGVVGRDKPPRAMVGGGTPPNPKVHRANVACQFLTSDISGQCTLFVPSP